MNNTERKLVQLYKDRAAKLSEKLDNDRRYRDLHQAYIYEQKYLYNHNEVLVEKCNRHINCRLKENWWTFKDESAHMNGIVQMMAPGWKALEMAGQLTYNNIADAE